MYYIKNNFLKIKNIINIYFNTKNYFKNNHHHTTKQTLNPVNLIVFK